MRTLMISAVVLALGLLKPSPLFNPTQAVNSPSISPHGSFLNHFTFFMRMSALGIPLAQARSRVSRTRPQPDHSITVNNFQGFDRG